MKIYTYYEDVGFKLQNELIDIWKRSWENNGFEAIFLSRNDAKKSPLFNEYYDFIQRVHDKSVNKILPENGYWLAAQLEIVSFHTIDEPSYISDYDMINNGFRCDEILESMVHWRHDACSCFASGDKDGWERYIKFLFENESTIVDWCKKENINTQRIEFGDQDFLVAVKNIGINKAYRMSRNINILGADYIPDQINTCQIPHLSHRNMSEIKNTYPKYANFSEDTIRIISALQILNNTYD